MADFTIKQGDTLPSLVANLKIKGAVLPDMANVTNVKLVMAVREAPDVYVFAKNATIVDVPTAKVQYDWAPGDTNTAGEYLANWILTYTGGGTRSVPTVGAFSVSIEPRLPATP